MHLHRRYRVQITVRVLLIVGSSLLLAYVIGWTRLYVASVAIAILIVYQIAGLIRYGERTARDLTRFLEAIRFSDFSTGFISGGRGPLFDRLRLAFDEVTDAFQQVRAEREERFRYLEHVVRHVGVALISFRADGEVQFINPAAKRLLEIGHIRHLQDLAIRAPSLPQMLLTLKSGEQARIKVERNGRTLQLQVSATQFRLRDDSYVLASIHDIGSELEEMEMEAWQKLTKVLTHEINNSVAPIASLASTADELLTKEAAANGARQHLSSIRDVHEAVRIIERRSRALVHFVDTYRSFTRIQRPSFEIFPAGDLLARVRRLLSGQIAAGAVECEIVAEPEDLVLTADPELMEQVMINLLLNAIDAVEGRPKARITLRAHVDYRGVPTLQVCDNGPGIPEDVQEHIFVPFFTTKEHGSGIGLSLSRQIMRLHGGSLQVQSEPGKGAVFTLRF